MKKRWNKEDIVAIILAAGRGTRMKSDVPKVLHEILGKPIIRHVLDSLKSSGISRIITVTGYGSSLLKDVLKGTKIVVQKELLGSGDAVKAAKKALGNYSGELVIICGDTPLIGSDTIRRLVERHRYSRASATLLTAKVKDPTGYGRIVRKDGRIARIVEEDLAPVHEKAIDEVNVGTYCFNAKDLFESLSKVKPASNKAEYYLTETIEILHKISKRIESVTVEDPDDMIGINTRSDLANATKILKNRILERVMSSGVTIEDTASTTIYPDAHIGRDTIIKPNTVIESDVRIGKNCGIGPFAHIRPGTKIGDNVEIGNFVELVRTSVECGTKVKHHTYLGDAVVGRNVNIGAGTITANYDGKKKNKTIIEDGSFIGVGAILIAPVKIGKNATVGAGCVVPKNRNVSKGATVVGVPARILKKSNK